MTVTMLAARFDGALPLPVVTPGHEAAGTIVETGAEVPCLFSGSSG